MSEFDYINKTYDLSLKKNVPVENKDGMRGQVVRARGQYIYIQWDGYPEPKGPYHPTSDLTYPNVTIFRKQTNE
jgi:hypothetical protein